MKRYLLFAILTVVSLGLDQWSKLWAEDALAPPCKELARTGDAVPELARCHDTRLTFKLGAPASRFALSDMNGVRWSVSCKDDAPCLHGTLKTNKPPESAEVTGGPLALRYGRWAATATGPKGAAASTLRFSYEPGPVTTLVAGYLDYRYVENPGATWGFLADQPGIREPVLISVAALAALFILWMAWRLQPGQHLLGAGLGLVLSGAIGNLIDRARLSYVIDFIDFHLQESFRWPTFNVADIAIVVGVGLLLLDSLRAWLRERKANKATAK